MIIKKIQDIWYIYKYIFCPVVNPAPMMPSVSGIVSTSRRLRANWCVLLTVVGKTWVSVLEGKRNVSGFLSFSVLMWTSCVCSIISHHCVQLWNYQGRSLIWFVLLQFLSIGVSFLFLLIFASFIHKLTANDFNPSSPHRSIKFLLSYLTPLRKHEWAVYFCF